MALPYTLTRSKRRTLALVVGHDGSLTARAPLRMPLRDIEAFIAQKEAWILKNQNRRREQALQVPRLESGASLPFCTGALTICSGKVPFPFAYHGALLLPQNPPFSASLCKWLRCEGEALLRPRVSLWENITGISKNKLLFSTAKTRWGSMNSRGEMRLNLALLLCSWDLIDYVIVHELCHRRHPNHSASFWQELASHMPDYSAKRARLKENNALIHLLGAEETK